MYNFTRQTPNRKISFEDIGSLIISIVVGTLFLSVIIVNLNNSDLQNSRRVILFLGPVVIILFIIMIFNIIRILSDFFLPLEDYNGEIAYLRSYGRRGYYYYYVYLQNIRTRFLIDFKSYFILKKGIRLKLLLTKDLKGLRV